MQPVSPRHSSPFPTFSAETTETDRREESPASSSASSSLVVDRQQATLQRVRFLHLQEQGNRLASAEQRAQFQKAKAVLEEAVQIVRDMEPDPDGRYMSAIHTLYQSTLPLELVKPDDQLLKETLYGTCDAIGNTYEELLAPALAKYEIALDHARKIPPHIHIDGIFVSDFISYVEIEKNDLLAIPKQAVEILKWYARICFFETVFDKNTEALRNIGNLKQHPSSNTVHGQMKITEEWWDIEKFNKHVGNSKKWKTAIEANYESLLPLYKTQSIPLQIVPVPKGTKAMLFFKVVIPLYSLKDVLSVSLQRTLRQNAILLREAAGEMVIGESAQLSAEVSNLYKSRNRRDADSYKNKRKNLLEKLKAYEDKHTRLMKEVKITLSRNEALLEAEENENTLHLSSFYKAELEGTIKIFSYAERLAILPSKSKLLLSMEHAGKDQQEVFRKLMESADHLEIICNHCFENSSILGGSKEFSEVPPSLLHKVVSMLIDNYQSLISSIDQAAADMEKTATTEEEKEIVTTLASFSAAASDIKEWLDMHVAYFHIAEEEDPHTDQAVREYLHQLFTPKKERLQAEEELASKNAAALLAELELEKSREPATSSVKAQKTKAKPSSSKQKKAHVDPIAKKLEIRSKAAMPAEASAALDNDLTEFKAWEGDITSAKIKEAAEATRKHTSPLDINSPLTDLMITVGKAVHAAERIGKHYDAASQQLDEHAPQRPALQKEFDKWHNKAVEQKTKLDNLEKQDLRLRLEKARTLFLEYPSGELFAFLLRHQGITSIAPRGCSELKVHRYQCSRKDLNGNPWLDATGNPVHDWIEPYKIYTGKNKYAVLHAHINPKDDSECTALHFKRRQQDLLGRQYEIRQAEAGNEERIYRKKANKKILEKVRAWGGWKAFQVVA